MKIRNTILTAGVLFAMSDANAAQICQACPPGQWTKNGKCVSCQEALGDTKYCPGGGISYTCPNDAKTLVATATSSSDCEGWGGGGSSNCSQGQYMKDSGCLLCPAGTYQDKGSHKLTSCTPCPAGQYQDLTGQASCKSCTLPQWSNAGETRCRQIQYKVYAHYWNGSSCTAQYEREMWVNAGSAVTCRAVMGDLGTTMYYYMGCGYKCGTIFQHDKTIDFRSCKGLTCSITNHGRTYNAEVRLAP
jgi:hypothetical protein